jgi:hypothetical protein
MNYYLLGNPFIDGYIGNLICLIKNYNWMEKIIGVDNFNNLV